MQVTEGLPAFRSLRAVLTEKEWQQVEPELIRYFSPSEKQQNRVSARCKRADSVPANSTATPRTASAANVGCFHATAAAVLCD